MACNCPENMGSDWAGKTAMDFLSAIEHRYGVPCVLEILGVDWDTWDAMKSAYMWPPPPQPAAPER